MRNYVKSNHTVTTEELEQVKEMDWDTYYRESVSTEMQGLSNCPNCSAIILVRGEDPDQKCYSCGCSFGPARDSD